jgi:hypothetical protein
LVVSLVVARLAVSRLWVCLNGVSTIGSSTIARGALGGGGSTFGAAPDGIVCVGGKSHSGRETRGDTFEESAEGGLEDEESVGVEGGDTLDDMFGDAFDKGVLGGIRAGGDVLRAVGNPPKRGRRDAGPVGIPPLGPLLDPLG